MSWPSPWPKRAPPPTMMNPAIAMAKNISIRFGLPFHLVVDALNVGPGIGHVVVLVLVRQLESACGLVRAFAGLHCGLGRHHEVAREIGVFPEIRQCHDGIRSNELHIAARSYRGRGVASDYRVDVF